MKEFENIVVGKSSIPSLAITVVCMLVIPVVFLVFWRRNHKGQTNFSYLIAGALGFIVSSGPSRTQFHLIMICSHRTM